MARVLEQVHDANFLVCSLIISVLKLLWTKQRPYEQVRIGIVRMHSAQQTGVL